MKYKVELKEENIYNFIIETDNEEQVENKAYKFYEQALTNNNLFEYIYDVDTNVSKVEALEEE